MNTKHYASDVTDDKWRTLELLIPAAKPGGRPHGVTLREVVNGIFCSVKTGCQWRMLPKECAHWETAYDCFAKWRKDGTWQRVNHAPREWVRQQTGRDKTPSAASIDSQSFSPTEQAMGGWWLYWTMAR